MKPMRTWRIVALTTVALAAAACSTSSTTTTMTTVHVGTSRTTTTTTAHGRTSTTLPSTPVVIRTTPPRPGSRCGNYKVVLRPGTTVPGVYLAALEVLSRTTAIGVTQSEIYCSTGPGGGGFEAFPAWLVVSTDGGRVWRTTGSQLPRALNTVGTLAFSSSDRGWLDASSNLAFTANGGRSWQVVRLDGAVESLASDGRYLAALAVNSLGNTARVWRLSATSTHREPEPVLHPPPRSQWSLMAVLPRSGDIVVYFQPFQGSAPLYVIDMSQSQWRTTTMPSCLHGEFDSLVGTSEDTLATICSLGDVGMRHEPKAFFLSVNGGRTWQRRSAALNPGGPDPSGIPPFVLMTLAASSPTTYYMATIDEVSVSSDAGRTWTQLAIGNAAAGGAPGATFSFVDPEHGWLLIPGAALLRTTDGRLWTALDTAPL